MPRRFTPPPWWRARRRARRDRLEHRLRPAEPAHLYGGQQDLGAGRRRPSVQRPVLCRPDGRVVRSGARAAQLRRGNGKRDAARQHRLPRQPRRTLGRSHAGSPRRLHRLDDLPAHGRSVRSCPMSSTRWRATSSGGGRNRDPDGRGLVSCGTSDVGDAMYRGNGLRRARNETGMDNSPTHDEARYDPRPEPSRRSTSV